MECRSRVLILAWICYTTEEVAGVRWKMRRRFLRRQIGGTAGTPVEPLVFPAIVPSGLGGEGLAKKRIIV
jgi:hypothetical protein